MFQLLFSSFLVRSLRPRLLSSSVLFFFSVLSSCSSSFVSFFVPVQPFPVFVFHASSLILLLGYSFVRAFVYALFSSSVVLVSSLFFLVCLRHQAVWDLPSRLVVPCFEFSFCFPFISPSSAFLVWLWLRFRFLFLYPSVSFPSDFFLAFCFVPAPSSVLSPPGLGVRLWVCARLSVASLLPLPLCFISGVLTFFSGLVFLPALLPLPSSVCCVSDFLRARSVSLLLPLAFKFFPVLCSLFPCVFSAFDSLQ